MKKISLNNGTTYLDAAEAMEQINARNLWDAVVGMMDDETRDKVHAELAPCTEEEFLNGYLLNAADDLVIG